VPNTAAEIQGTGLKIRNNLREQIDLVIEAGGEYLRDWGECTSLRIPPPTLPILPYISHHHPRVIPLWRAIRNSDNYCSGGVSNFKRFHRLHINANY
jgi:hypothetical protein